MFARAVGDGGGVHRPAGIGCLECRFRIQLRTQLLFEAALVVALLGFIGTVALSKYVTRGDIIE